MKYSFYADTELRGMPLSERQDKAEEVKKWLEEAEAGIDGRLPFPKRLKVVLGNAPYLAAVRSWAGFRHLDVSLGLFDLLEGMSGRPRLALGTICLSHELSHLAEFRDRSRLRPKGDGLFAEVIGEGKAEGVAHQVLQERGLPDDWEPMPSKVALAPMLKGLGRRIDWPLWERMGWLADERLGEFAGAYGTRAPYRAGTLVVAHFMESEGLDIFEAHKHPPAVFLPSFQELLREVQ